jgi:hypothetical protein
VIVFTYKRLTSGKLEVLSGNVKPIAYLMKNKLDVWQLIVTVDSMLTVEGLEEITAELKRLNKEAQNEGYHCGQPTYAL